VVAVGGTPLRGEVWLCAFRQPVGPHPAVVLTVNRIAQPLASITVALITGTEGPSETHVPVSAESGLTKYDESYVNCTDIHTVNKPQLRRRLGLLAQGELRAVEGNIRVILGLG
jgi:mRNA interferase MazF